MIVNATSWLFALIPKIKGQVVFFGPTHNKYADNVRYLFEYISLNDDCIKIYWITNDSIIEKYLKDHDFNCIRKNTFRAFFIYITAEYLVSGETIPPRLYAINNIRAKKICTSHGFGPRSICASDGDIFKSNKQLFNGVQQYDYYLFPTKYMANILGKLGYNFPRRKIIIAQQPRITNFQSQTSISHHIEEGIKIIYAPTWRRTRESALSLLTRLTNGDINKLNSYLKEIDATISILSHPLSNNSFLGNGLSQISIINGPLVDATEKIFYADILISDYSSLITDAIAFNKKIGIFAPDYDEYQFVIGMNTFLKHDLPDSFINTFDDFKSFISSKGNSRIIESYHEKFVGSEMDGRQHILELIRSHSSVAKV